MAGTLGEIDLHLFREGTHARLYERLGAHPVRDGDGVDFAVWAPNASAVAVIGDWNGWNADADRLQPAEDGSGIWFGRAAGARPGQVYKYRVHGARGYTVDKADPFARMAELPPATGSRICLATHAWADADWMAQRGRRNALDAPMSVYELHAGSWQRKDGQPLPWRELAPRLVEHITRLGFTHVELMPITEHPFYGSWGYQATGYFAPSSRYGTPEDFKAFVDALHQAGIGVILDWVPSHFPTDEFGLQYFDGTHLYEHADPRQGFHPEWNSSIFNLGRGEVSSFLLSSALYWLSEFHLDGLRVDAVASMLYLDYARKHGEWIPNIHGGRENLEAIQFLRRLNEAVYREHPDVVTIAEESTAWPMVSRPTTMGGLGFGMKWNMGWMHDTLSYFKQEPIHRRYHHHQLTFSLVYAFSENFVLPLSHDEVVYGKGSLIGRMPGDDWQKFANLRALLGYMWTHPGKKLLFMGGEFGQWREWNHDAELDWHLLEQPRHQGLQRWVADLNRLLRAQPALHQRDVFPDGFQWLIADDSDHSVFAFLRRPDPGTAGPPQGSWTPSGGGPGEDRASGHHVHRGMPVIVACNLTPVPRERVLLGVPAHGRWAEVLNSDAELYGGSGLGNLGGVDSRPLPAQGQLHSVRVTLPPLGLIVLQHQPNLKTP